MGKKAKAARKDSYKSFLNGMVKYREKFTDAKIKLIEAMLANENLKKSIMEKDRTGMTKVERAAVDTLLSREIENLEQFQEIKDKIKENEVRRAKFKYTPKEI